jgi:hypothetical protein
MASEGNSCLFFNLTALLFFFFSVLYFEIIEKLKKIKVTRIERTFWILFTPT